MMVLFSTPYTSAEDLRMHEKSVSGIPFAPSVETLGKAIPILTLENAGWAVQGDFHLI